MDGYAAAWLVPRLCDSRPDALHALTRRRQGRVRPRRDEQPRSRGRQQARIDDEETVAERVAHDVAARTSAPRLARLGRARRRRDGRSARFGLTDIVLAGTPILAPGFGAQGAEPADLGRLFGYVASQVVASESRSVLSAGPERLAARIEERAALYRGG
jgi:orotidine-5'-phosphate decarboxylase